MILLIAGASHTGKTLLAQRLLERYHYPYLSMDHLKMGLIRSGNTDLTPMDDDRLTDYLWPIVREMVKTAIENGQNLIVEGCYIPFEWQKDFAPEYLEHIRYRCLVMSRRYIEKHFEAIRDHACAIEQRLDDSDLSAGWLIRDNEENLRRCRESGCGYVLIEDGYEIPLEEIVPGSGKSAMPVDMAKVLRCGNVSAEYENNRTLCRRKPTGCGCCMDGRIYQKRKSGTTPEGGAGFPGKEEAGRKPVGFGTDKCICYFLLYPGCANLSM